MTTYKIGDKEVDLVPYSEAQHLVGSLGMRPGADPLVSETRKTPHSLRRRPEREVPEECVRIGLVYLAAAQRELPTRHSLADYREREPYCCLAGIRKDGTPAWSLAQLLPSVGRDQDELRGLVETATADDISRMVQEVTR